MSYYITTSTAKFAYYNDLTDAAKDEFFYELSKKHYHEIPEETKTIFYETSKNVKLYINTEDEQEQEKLWLSFDKYSQYMADPDKYRDYYKDTKRAI